MNADITVIGDVNVDLLTNPIPTLPKKDSQVVISDMNLTIGGGAANFAFTISKLGLKTRLIGLIGNDVFGKYIIKKAKEFGIDNKIETARGERTGVTFGAQLKDGSRSLFTFRGTNALFSTKNFNLGNIEGKVLHIGGYNFLDSFRKDVYKIAKYVRKKGMLFSLDPDIKSGIRFDTGELIKTLKSVDFFFPNRIEGMMLTGKKKEIEIVKTLLKFGCRVVALKCGEKGCVIGSKNKISTIKGINVKPVSPTGIGDIFNAAFIFSYIKTGDIKKAAVFANAAGALAIIKIGEKRYQTEKEVIRFLKNNYEKNRKDF